MSELGFVPEQMGLVWGVPFLGLLVSIGIGSAAFPHQWERRYKAVTAFWCLAVVGPTAFVLSPGGLARELARTLLADYLPFILSIASLFAVVSGIRVRTRLSGHPLENAVLLAGGTLAGGALGTPGATLLVLPILLASNAWRRYRTHSVVFLILLVSNMGGGLSPLGPPLLIGYLHGVAFQWTVETLAAPTLLASAILLAGYLVLDLGLLFPREDGSARAAHRAEHDEFGIEGGINLILLAATIAVQFVCGNWHSETVIPLGVIDLPLPDLARIAALLAVVVAALGRLRGDVSFSWEPMTEVAVLFAGIFITMAPCLAILEAGHDGALGGLIDLVTSPQGRPISAAYFGVTGALSAFLDNAPTFLVFFHVAGGDAGSLMAERAGPLAAMSAGAAFWGGLTYIGNAPNLLVRSIAEYRGVSMPSFFGFILWAGLIALPVFAVIAWVFYAAPVSLLAAFALWAVVPVLARRGARRSGF